MYCVKLKKATGELKMPIKLNQPQRHFLLFSAVVQLSLAVFFVTEEHYIAAVLLTLGVTVSMAFWLADFKADTVSTAAKKLAVPLMTLLFVGLIAIGLVAFDHLSANNQTASNPTDDGLRESIQQVLPTANQSQLSSEEENRVRLNELYDAAKRAEAEKNREPNIVIDIETLKPQANVN